ncbi:MAG: ribonuclease P protein component [Longimicrobiales bacterium]
MPRSRRIRRSRDIRQLLRRGKRSRTADLDVFDSDSPAGFSRGGWIVPRHRRNAVERNRLKRRLREILRRDVLPRFDDAALHIDVLVRARPEAYDATFSALREELTKWAVHRSASARRSG